MSAAGKPRRPSFREPAVLEALGERSDPIADLHAEVVGGQHFIRELPGIGHYPQLEVHDRVVEEYDAFRARIGA